MTDTVPEIQLRNDDPQVEAYHPSITLRWGNQGIAKLTEAVAKARPNFAPVVKTADNPYFKGPDGKPRKYADLTEIINATAGALAEQGITIFQAPSIDNDKQTVGLVTLVSHSSGEWLEATANGCPAVQKSKDRDDRVVVRFDAQTIGIAISYMRRYTMSPILNLGAEDDDGNSISSTPQPERTTEDRLKRNPARVLGNVQKASDAEQISGKYRNPPVGSPTGAVIVNPGKIVNMEEPVKVTPVIGTNHDADGVPVSDEDLDKPLDPLPTPDQSKENATALRALGQDSRKLKAYIEKQSGVEWKKITQKQFEEIIPKLKSYEKDKLTSLVEGTNG